MITTRVSAFRSLRRFRPLRPFHRFRSLRRSARRALVTAHARLVTGERGQATVEYALVMIGVAAVAGLLIGWVRGTDLIERLFDRVVNQITP